MFRALSGVAAALVLNVVFVAPSNASAQSTPTELLQTAKVELDKISPAGVDQNATAWIAILKKDFADLQFSYAAQASPNGAGPSPRAETTRDWRDKYAAVASDLVSLDTVTSVSHQLRAFRGLMDQFYAAADPKGAVTSRAMTQAPGGAAPAATAYERPDSPPCTHATNRDATVLLERIESLVDRSLAASKDQDVESLAEAGKIEVDRAALNEMRALLGQAKAMLSR